MLTEILFVIGAYLFGSVPVLFWIGKLNGFDLRQDSDMHLSLWRKVGYKEGLAGILWDLFKGPVPPVTAWLLDFDILIIALSGLAVVAGQMWPIFLCFQNGEKGNTTGIGASFGIAPLAMGIAAIPIAIGALLRAMPALRKNSQKDTDSFKFSGVSNSMPLGMLTGFTLLPIVAWYLDQDPVIVWAFVGLYAMIIFRRLTADLTEELREGLKANLASVLKNRFLYDRSYY